MNAAINTAVKPLSDKIVDFEQNSALEKRTAAISEAAKRYGIPESQVKRYNIPDDANLDEYFKDAKQELVDLGFNSVESPDQGGAQPKTEEDGLIAAINQGTQKIVEQNKK